ncbi:MAG: hypothetical protein QOJ91_2990 [Sphingomonadales bacterium]|jgi:hypothetical protein|nr:hypothetical protein [Sphingomonadales bacterium]
MTYVTPAKAGASGRPAVIFWPEVPASGFPKKYYFFGVPPGMTVR